MNESLREKLDQIFLQKFGDKFQLGVERKAYSKWDSLNHVKLILELEKEFDVKFSIPEAVAIQSTSDLLRVLSEKCQK